MSEQYSVRHSRPEPTNNWLTMGGEGKCSCPVCTTTTTQTPTGDHDAADLAIALKRNIMLTSRRLGTVLMIFNHPLFKRADAFNPLKQQHHDQQNGGLSYCCRIFCMECVLFLNTKKMILILSSLMHSPVVASFLATLNYHDFFGKATHKAKGSVDFFFFGGRLATFDPTKEKQA